MRPGAMTALLGELMRSPGPEIASWADALEPGAVVGRFELVRELGRGGFGVVWEARDRTLGRNVAFKAVRAGTSAKADEQRVLREAEVAARLSHPNIVTLYDVGRSAHGPYLVLELLEGRTLAQRLDDGPLTLREAVRISVEVAKGIAHAHAHGVVHRDLTPGNVFLCDDGQVKVLDLGMAQAFGRRKVDGGTPSYMAPEQSRGAPEDERTDVFALGVLLYRMLANELPWPKQRGWDDRVAAPQLEIVDAPALGALVGRMLESDPVRRPRDAGEVLRALAGVQQELSREPSVSGGIRTRKRRRIALARGSFRRWALAAATIIAAFGIGVASWTALRGRRAPVAEASVAVLPFTSLSRDAADAAFADGLHLEVLTQLANISGVRVIGPGSVASYRDGPRNLRSIASDLRVRSILEGSVQRSGGRVRATVHLVDPTTGHELWAERYDRDLTDVFQIQSDVALSIARTLGATLSPSERRVVERRPTANPEAHELYLRARHLWSRSVNVESDNAAAEALLEDAIEVDPGFAEAHALLAVVEVASWQEEPCAEAFQHASRALQLDPELAAGHRALGDYFNYCGKDRTAAAREYELAAQRAPGDAEVRTELAVVKLDGGEVEGAMADVRRALTLEPRSLTVAANAAILFASAKRYADAEEVLESVNAIVPGDPGTSVLRALVAVWHRGDVGAARALLDVAGPALSSNGLYAYEMLAFLPQETLASIRAGRLADPVSASPLVPRALVAARAHEALGEPSAARREFESARGPLEREVRRNPEGAATRVLLARVYAGVGRPDDAIREADIARDLAMSERARAMVLLYAADCAAAVGRTDAAVEALTAALSRPVAFGSAAALRVDPRFAQLRRDPRVEALLARDAR